MSKITRVMAMLMCVVLVFSALPLVQVSAAEAGTTPSNPIKLTEGQYYSKYWTYENDDLNCYNEIKVPSRGCVTITIPKVWDDEGEICGFGVDIYNKNGDLMWEGTTNGQTDTFASDFVLKVGLAAGTYYMNLDPSFYLYSYSAPIKTTYKYDFTANNYWEIEPNNTVAKATKLSFNNMYSAAYVDESSSGNYMDYFSFNLTKGCKYTIKITNLEELIADTSIVYLLDNYGEEISCLNYSMKISGNTGYYTYTPKTTGAHYIKVYNDGWGVPVIYKVGVYDQSASIKASLSKTSYVYDGNVKTPSVKVTNSSGKALVKGTDYTVVYASGRKTIGQYCVKVNLKGKYSGAKYLYFNILPAQTSKVKATQTTNSITLSWDAVKGATGYRIYRYYGSTKQYVKVATVKSRSYTIKNLAAGTTYAYLIRTYSTVNGKTYWSDYTTANIFYTATKPATPTVKTASTAKGRATVAWDTVKGATGYQVYYSTEKTSGYKKIDNYGADKTKMYKTGLKSGNTYYFRVKAFRKVGSTYIYSGYSSAATVKIK